jgi:hypothetical protein
MSRLARDDLMCELSEWNNDSDVGQQRKLTMQNGTDCGGSIVIKGVPERRNEERPLPRQDRHFTLASLGMPLNV